MVAKVRTIDFLPEIFKTTPNENFLSATLDQLVQQQDLEKLQGYIGRRFEYGLTPNSYYIPEINKTRTDYQLEPAVVFKKKDTNTALDFISYPEMIDALKLQGAPITNNSLLFDNQFYSWDSFADLDKISNYSQYYWLPFGPDVVNVEPLPINLTSFFNVVSQANEFLFVQDNFQIEEFNPTITLLRGGTYYFNIDQESKFWIQTEPGLSGTVPNRPNASTRDIFGVENNGTNEGVITFNVPNADAQDETTYSGNVNVDLVSDQVFSAIHGQRLSTIGNIDGATNLLDKTLLFFGSPALQNVSVETFFDDFPFDQDSINPLGFDSTTFVNVNQYFFKVNYIETDVPGDPIINLSPLTVIPQNTNITVLSGNKYVSKKFVRLQTGEIQIIPELTAPLDVLYYQDSSNRKKFGVIKIVDNNTANFINVEKEILGKLNYTSPNNVKFTNGLKINFSGDIIPEKYKNDQYYVEGVGTGIKLIPSSALVTPESYSQNVYEPYDAAPYDIAPYSDITESPITPDYLTISRAANNLNSWSRGNRWFHAQVLQETIKHTNSTNLLNIVNSKEARAKRPIVEFYPNLKLFNLGTEAKGPVDYFDITATDAFTQVANQLQYYPDGSSFGLFDGCRVIFSADNDINVRNKIFRVNFISTSEANQTSTLVSATTASNDRLTVTDSTKFIVGSLVSVNENIGGLTAFTKYYVYDKPNTSSLRLSTDPNLSSFVQLTNDTGNVLLSQSPPVITLTKIAEGDIQHYDQTVVLLGENRRGFTYWFDGTNWIQGQNKTTVNQPPLFDVFDNNGLSYGDTDYYNSSSFVGSSLFQYATGTGNDDPILGFPLKYSSVDNVGDIQFNVSFNTDQFTYVLNGNPTVQNVNEGYPYIFTSREEYTRQLGWQTAISESIQYQAFTFNYIPQNGNAVFICDIPANSSESTAWPVIKVYVGDNLLFDSDFTFIVENKSTIITLNANPILETPVEVLIYSNSVSKNAYFTIPTNLENNIFNAQISNLNLGDIKNHYLSICTNSKRIVGQIFGSNNYRDLPNLVKYGSKIIQNSAPLSLTGALLKNANFNLIDSLNFSSTEYIKFKNLLIDVVNKTSYESYQIASVILDNAINEITSYKMQNNSFFWSDMLPSRGAYITNRYTFNADVSQAQFTLSKIYDFTAANYNGVLLYLQRKENGLVLERQLIKDVDYVVSADAPLVTLYIDLIAGDIIVVNEYNQTYGSYVPNTPTKLGFYPATIPEIVYDTSYINPTWFIKGHDGSLTSLYGDYTNGYLNDYRDQVIFEFECRIYNNLKVSSKIPIASDEVLPGQFRSTNYNYDEILQLYSLSFLNWVGQNRIDYKSQYYLTNNSYTYNYYKATNRLDNTIVKRGNWRGLYNWFFDTTTPNSTPWEMIGYTSKPTWWDSYYGAAPYTKNNLVLWTDMENGYDYNNGNPIIIESRKRPGLLKVLPVDDLGNLVDPMNSVIGNYDSLTFQTQWKVGDWGPAEYSYLKSSSWPFDLVKMLALCKPAKFFALGENLDTYKFNKEFNQYLLNDKFRFTTTGAVVYGSGKAQHSYLNWIVDYVQSNGNSGYDVLTDYLNNLDVRLVYRLAGFSDKDLLKFYVDKGSPNSKNNSLLIPDESYRVILHENQPFDTIIYSSIIVQKTDTGYQVFGNSQNKIYFKALSPIVNGKYDTITSGSLSVRLSKNFSDKVVIVPYSTEFSTPQALSEFINAYGNYLSTQGLLFDQVENNLLLNWNQMIQEVLAWVQAGWEPGSILNINPLAQKIVINKENSIVQPLTIQDQNYILNQNLIPIQIKDMSVVRNGVEFSAIPLKVDDTISYFTANLSNIEHAIIFDNTTLFNDLIYDPNTGLRQYRILLKGAKTATWDGTVDTKGFILNQDNILEWQSNVKYTKGIIVKYKNNYYAANEVIQPAETFQQGFWTKVDYEDIQKGLLPNASSRAFESTLYYDSYKANLENDADLLAFSLIGYRPRDYLAAANLDDISQVNLYKTMIVEKGSKQATSAIQNITLQTGGINYTTYENWAINIGNYGGLLNQNFIEFKLEEQKLNGNPAIVSIINGVGEIGSMQEIPIYGLSNYGRVPQDIRILPLLPSYKMNQLPSAGYVNFDDVKAHSYKVTTLNQNSVSIYDIYKNEYIWIADYKNEWQVYSTASLSNSGSFVTLTSVVNNLNDTCTVFFDKPHGLSVSDIIFILNYSTFVDGFHVVVKINSINSIVIDLSLPLSISNIESSGIAAKLQNQRVNAPKDISTLNLLDTEFVKNTVWVDENTDGTWAVYRKSINYVGATTFSKPTPTTTFGSSVAYDATLGYFLADSGAGNVYRYKYVSNVNFWNLEETITLPSSPTGFGASMDKQQNFLTVLKSAATSLVYIYELVQTNKIEAVALQNSFSISGITDKVIMSGDCNYFFVGKGSTRQVFVYRKNTYLTYTSIGYPLTTAIEQNGTQFTVSGDRRSLLLEGQMVSFSNSNTAQTYKVITGEYNVSANTTKFTIDGYFFANVAAGTTVYRAYYDYTNVATITGSGSATNFGKNIATNNNATQLFVSAPNQDFSAVTDTGAVYIYERIKQTFESRFTAIQTLPTDFILAWVPINSITVFLNGDILSSSYYSVAANILTITVQINAGDLITVESNDFVLSQTLVGHNEVANPRVGILYGQGLDTNNAGNELLIGSPFDIINSTGIEGTVYRYTNAGKKFGIITGSSTYSLSTQKNVLINGFMVILPSTGINAAITAINEANIPNVQASKTDDNKLIIQLINQNLNLSGDKLNLTVFDQADFASLGITYYTKTQELHDPNLQNATQYGTSIKFNEFNSVVITAPTSNRYTQTTFDFTDDEDYTNDTIFDNNFTSFIDVVVEAGSAYLYDYLGAYNESIDNVGKFVLSQLLNDTTSTLGNAPYYGNNIAFNNYNVIIGSPTYLAGSQNGRVNIFRNDIAKTNWSVYRSPEQTVDIEKLHVVSIYNNLNNLTIVNLDYIDPLQGKLLGAVRENLDFISSVDPAGYNNSPTTGKVVWGQEYIGKLWFDTSQTKFIDYHQNDTLYNSRYWGTVFPGSLVSVYTWIESDVIPIDYVGVGSVYDIDSYTTLYEVIDGGTIVTRYYYWVKNIGTVIGKNKTLADNIISAYIANPTSSGIAFLAPLKQNVFGLYNVFEYISSNFTSLHLGYKSSTGDDVAHTEFKLIRDGYAEDFLPGLPTLYNNLVRPNSLYQKLLDSFAGDDAQGQAVPNPFLPKLLQTGTSIRPNQSFFYNRLTALQNYCEFANRVMLKFPITELKNPSFLSLGGVALTGANAPAFFTLSGDNFDTNDYWEYVNWWEEGYSDATRTDIDVPKYYDLDKLTPFENMIAGVNSNSNGKREVYIYKDNNWNRIGLELGTIQIKNSLWDYTINGIGFGDSFFDNDVYDNFPSVETYYIIRGLNEEVFTDDLLIYRNQGLILLFQYIITESDQFGNYLPWLTKTSFLDVDHTLRELEQTKNFQRDNEDFLFGYINEVKPYRVKLKEFSLKYTKTNLYDGDITDFDLPAKWNENLNSFVTPELVFNDSLLPSQYKSTNTIWQEPQYNQWFNNYGVKLEGRSNYFIGLLKEYVPVATKIVVVDNAFGYPVSGVIKIDDEFIGYNNVDRDAGVLFGLTRGAFDTEVVDHMPGSKIFIDLPAVSVLYAGRAYTEPPNIITYVDTSVFPAPKVQAALKAQMSGEEVIAVTVLNSGEGYKVLPEIIVEPAIEHKFNTTDINYTNYTVNVPFKLFETGDLLQYRKGENLTSILGLIDKEFYYIRLIEYGLDKPEVTLANEDRPTAIAFYGSKINAITDRHRLNIIKGRTESNNHILSLGARLAPISSNAPTRQITPSLKFDRTSYRPTVELWEPNQFYIADYNSIGNDASFASKLATALPYTSVTGPVTPAGGTGAIFDVYAWIYGNEDEPPYFYSSGNTYGVYTANINSGGLNYQIGDVITISGDSLGGVAPTNSCTITVTQTTLSGTITEFTTEGIPSIVLNSSLQGATLLVSSITTELETNNVIVTFDYSNSSLTPGYLKNVKMYFYKTERLTTPYVYDDSGSGGAIIWVTSPRIFGKTVLNEYTIDIKDFGNIYTTGDTITIAGNLLGGATPANDLVITITFAFGGEIVFYSINGICSNAYAEYYTVPINTTQCRLFNNSILTDPVKNTIARPFIFTAGDIGFYPEPFTSPSASLVAYNNKLYKCIESNSDLTFDFTKWELLQSDYPYINALDRIVTYYEPTSNMPGKHLPLLLSGLEYPNGTYLGNKFNENIGIDVNLQGQPFYPNEIDIKSIVYDGSKYVAIGNTPNHATILYSVEGRNWSFKKISDVPINVTSLIYSGSFFVITAQNSSAPLLISYDGFNWVSVGSYTVFDDAPFDVTDFDTLSVETPNDELNAVAYYNNNYVAVGNNVLTSLNATSWGVGYSFQSQLPNTLTAVTYVAGSNIIFEGYVAVGSGTSIIEGVDSPSPVFAEQSRVLISYDGSTWSNTNQTIDAKFNTVFSSNSKIIAAGDSAKIYWSINASNWTEATILGPAITTKINHGIFALNTYILIGDNGLILYSGDGEVWNQTAAISINNLNEITFDGTYLIAVGENSTILRSTNIIDWENISFLVTGDPEYVVQGETFMSGYGPEEMIPAVITDNLQMLVKTTPGSLWDPNEFENFGFTIVGTTIDTGNATQFSFAGLSNYTTQIAVYIVSNSNTRATRIYSVTQVPVATSLTRIQSIDWVNKTVTLTAQLNSSEKIYVECYDIGGGNQQVKGTSNTTPIKLDTEKNVSYIDTNYPYKEFVYQYPVVYRNGTKLIENTDYSLEPNVSNSIKIVFNTVLNLNTDYISFAIFGPTATNQYQYCMPETQVFQYTSGPRTFTLTNSMSGTNPTNAIVEVDGIRARNTIDYTIVGDTLTILPSIPTTTIVSVTSFNDTQNQYFVTQTSTSVRVTPIYYVNTPATPVVVTTAINPVLVDQDQVLIDGAQNIPEINNNIFYVRVLPTYVENAVTYYRYELYLDINLSIPAVGNTYGSYYVNGTGSGGYIWKYSNTIQLNQPTFDVVDVNRLFVHINGTRVTPDNLRINQPNNRLSIMSPVSLGNTVIVTSFMPSATPNELWYSLSLDRKGDMTIANSNIQNRTWLVAPLYPTDAVIYVKDVSTLLDDETVSATAQTNASNNKIVAYLNYNIVDIVLLTIYNETTETILDKSQYYLNTVNSTTQVIFTSDVSSGDNLTFFLRFGKTIIINGEKISFRSADIVANTLSGITRGVDGTAALPVHETYSYVLSLSTKDLLDPFYYDKVWNSDDYSAGGDPLQISNSIPANFLKSD